MADTEQKIIQQFEFYFGDSNYPKDKFLRAQAALNEEGYIAIAVLSTFNRIKSITTDVDEITNALKKSSLLKVSDDGKMVKRVNPLPTTDDSNPRTVYVKGVDPTSTIEEITSAFAPFGKVLCVRKRKTPEKTYKDSAFVEYATAEEAQAATKAELPKVKDAAVAKVMMKEDYWKGKKEEKKQGKRKADDVQDGKEEKREFQWTKGLIVRYEAIGENVERPAVKDVFSAYGNVAFVDHNTAEKSGYVRYTTGDEAKKAATELAATPKEIGGKPVQVKLLEGAEEEAYWKIVEENMMKKKEKMQGGKGRKGGNKKFKKRN